MQSNAVIDLDQYSDLENLCKDRPLETCEIFSQNSFYGIDKVIKRYAGVDPKYKLKLIIPHGITFSSNFSNDAEKKSKLPVILSYPEYRTKSYRTDTKKVVINSASPFCYLPELFQSNYERKGLVIFPAHSTQYVRVENDYSSLIQKLDTLPNNFFPIVICIYWKDFLEGQHKPFIEKGYQVITAGHIYDENFLYRFYDICLHFEYAASNDIGSSIFYSALAGCKTFIFSDLLPDYHADRDILKRDQPDIQDAIKDEILMEFDMTKVELDKRESKIVAKYLSYKHRVSPFSMKLLIYLSEVLYKLFILHKRVENQIKKLYLQK